MLWPLVVARVPQAQLEIWGSGPDEQRLREIAQASPAAGSISLPGFTREGSAQMARAWCTVMTSKRECFPLTILESLAVGAPVVAFDVPYGPREAIGTGVDGYLVADRDTSAYARTLADLLTSPDLVDTLSARALGPGGVRERFGSEVTSGVARPGQRAGSTVNAWPPPGSGSRLPPRYRRPRRA